MAYLKFFFKSIVYVIIILVLVTFIPGIPPGANNFSEYSIVPANKNFLPNEKLNDPELLFQGKIKGPESFTSYNGELYTGSQNGYVLKITKDNKIVPVVKFGKDCDGYWQEEKCGRPLGLKFDQKGQLYVSDAYYGIFKVDVKTGKYEKLIDSKEPIEGKKPMIVNSLEIASNGDIYWTDSCTEFNLKNGVYCMIINPSGRLIRYNRATKKNQVLVHDLGFANGITLSKDESFVIVLETSTSRITKYNIKGTNAGKKEIFIEGLPGLPDNIHSDGENGYLISLVAYRDSQNPVLTQSLAPHPYVRRLIARLLLLLETPFECLQTYYPNYIVEKIIYYLGGFETMMFLTPKVNSILRIDQNGKIIDTAYGFDGKINGITSAYIHDGYLWFGFVYAEHIARLQLDKVFPDLVQRTNKNPKLSKTAKKISK